MSKNILQIKDLSVIYKSDEVVFHAVNKINLVMGFGETLGLVGETGAGKTTTALTIMSLLPERTGIVTSGEVLFEGENLLRKSKEEMRQIRGSLISMIFQDPMTSLNPVLRVGDQILESLEIHNIKKRPKRELEKRVDELLELVRIPPTRKDNYPHEFSGGMKQRVMIAMALACKPELLIADEPTTALDVTIQAQVLALMNELKKSLATSIIMITHDMGVVAEMCDKVAVMYAGEIVEYGSVYDIFEGKQHHPYTQGLFESIPDIEVHTRRLNPIEGLMPDPSNLPTGCKFHPRCKYCREICRIKPPQPVFTGQHSISCHLFAKEAIKWDLYSKQFN